MPDPSRPAAAGERLMSPDSTRIPGNRSVSAMLEDVECIGTGTDVECVIPDTDDSRNMGNKIAARAVKEIEFSSKTPSEFTSLVSGAEKVDIFQEERSDSFDKQTLLNDLWRSLLLISPFFFWGTAMVAMKGVLPKAGPLFVAATRLIPAGLVLVAFAHYKGRKQPECVNAWLAIALFAFVDASCFQGFLAEGLKRTSAGLGSVIIDSQPLTVAVLASLFFEETIGALGIVGLATGFIGLLLLEMPMHVIEDLLKGQGFNAVTNSTMSTPPGSTWSIWDSGEWWMLLAAQSMAVGTVMVRWICQFSDPIMATGWHMVLGGLPLLAFATIQQEPALAGHFQDLQLEDWLALGYTSFFGSAISYGVFFYSATRGSLTKLSSLTFLTPMFAAFFGYLFLDETLTPVQIVGAVVTLASIYLVNTRASSGKQEN